MIDTIIPCRNAPDVLAMTLAHYWANAHTDRLVASVTLLDNCSDVSGMELVFCEALRRGCRVIRHERNIGVWASVNRGLALSRSEHILVLTSDILLGPGAVTTLAQMQEGIGIPYLGPTVVSDQFAYLPQLYSGNGSRPLNPDHYNGACWLMARSLLETVGWYDPQFYICFGDVDYAQRVRDAGLRYAITGAALCLHLDKRSRQADHTIDQDNEVEVRDAERFHEKWRDRPDVLAKHPIPDRIMYAMNKARYWRQDVVSGAAQ